MAVVYSSGTILRAADGAGFGAMTNDEQRMTWCPV
jgi:hypothetical protein